MVEPGDRSARLGVGSLLLAVALVGLACRTEAVQTEEPALVDCEAAEDPWVVSACERIRTHDGLYRIAVASLGATNSCGALASSEFDGAKFGTFRCAWTAGHHYALTTLPPESSITELLANEGFSDAPRVQQAVQDYVRGLGLPIDWSKPSREERDDGWVDEFTGGPSGLNATVRLRYTKKGALVEIRVSMAL